MSDEDQSKEKPRGWWIIEPVWNWLERPPEWFARLGYCVAVLVVVPLLLVGFGALFFFGYEMFVGKSGDRIEAAKVFFPVLIALIGGPVLIWRAITGHWSAQAARYQADTDREGLYTGLFTKAVEQLGATREVTETVKTKGVKGAETTETITRTEPNLEVRLGAIYALERIAQDSERDHWPIMEVLAAYIQNRQNCGEALTRPDSAKWGSPEFDRWLYSIPRSRVDIQAALNVIGRRPRSRVALEKLRNLRINLSDANLQRANFRGTFVGIYLNRANLDRATFYNADLDGAEFDWATLVGARCLGANLRNADLDGTVLDGVHFLGAKMAGVSFFNANFTQANISTEQVAETIGDASTQFPENKRPGHWRDQELSWQERVDWASKIRG